MPSEEYAIFRVYEKGISLEKYPNGANLTKRAGPGGYHVLTTYMGKGDYQDVPGRYRHEIRQRIVSDWKPYLDDGFED